MKPILRKVILAIVVVVSLHSCKGVDFEGLVGSTLLTQTGKEEEPPPPKPPRLTYNAISRIIIERNRIDAYKRKQMEVPYRNQRINKNGGDVSCNVTALSEAFAFFDITISPDELSDKLEKYCSANKYVFRCDRENPDIRINVAMENGLTGRKFDGTDIFKDANAIEKAICDGKAVLISGMDLNHIVRVIDVGKNETGEPFCFIVNDNYGCMNIRQRQNYIQKKKELDAMVGKRQITPEQRKTMTNNYRIANGDGYAPIPPAISARRNEKNDPNSEAGKYDSSYGKLNIWRITDIKSLKYYEIYGKKSNK